MIEDCLADVVLIENALRDVKVSYVLTRLCDGKEALAFVGRQGECAEALIPDIVLLDLGLPAVNGIEVLRAIRNSVHLREVAVIVVSVSRSLAERKSVEDLGAELFWTKPMSADGFLDLAEIVKSVADGFVRENDKA